MTSTSDKKDIKVRLYTLCTCPWCKKTKNLLNELGVNYSAINVDLLPEAEAKQTIEEVSRWNPAASFPTMVVNDSKTVIGFNESRIRELVTEKGG